MELLAIRSELELYKIRQYKIEDMKLELLELELDSSLVNAQQYEESVQTSRNCSNNDKALFRKQNIEKMIKAYTIYNVKVENMINRVEHQARREVLYSLYIEHNSFTKTAIKVDRSARHVREMAAQGLEDILEIKEMLESHDLPKTSPK